MTEQLMIPPTARMVHEPHGFIAQVKVVARDIDVVNAARVSYGKRSLKLGEGDEGLIGYLLAGKHGTPFEHNFFCFHVRAPLFVFREWHRHRIGWSYNEESARYVQLQPDFYIPAISHCRKQVGKPGHYTYEQMSRGDAEQLREELKLQHDADYLTYERLMSEGVAKEIARMCLPVAIYSQMYATCNARSLMNFLALRNDEKAMREIKDYARVLEQLFEVAMPVTYQAFVANGRVAP